MNESDVLGERLWPSRFGPCQKRVPVVSRTHPSHLSARFSPGGRYGIKQRAVVKAHYTSAKSLKSHLRYVQREGVGLDGKRPELFTANGRTVQIGEIEGEPRIFRIILSPENGARIEKLEGMQHYTRDFMKEFERATARELQWCATIHYNTSNPHAHILIRGIDAHGNAVVFDSNIFRSQAREIAQERATKVLGYRTPSEIRDQIARELVSERFTSIDRSIYNRLEVTGHFIPLTPVQQERLDYLGRLGLAEKTGKNLYALREGWKKTLENNGRKNDIIKAIYNEAPSKVRHLWEADRLSTKPFFIAKSNWIVCGRIVASGFENELSQKPYVLIESKPALGPSRLYYYSHQSLAFSELRPGRETKLDHGVMRFGKDIELSRERRRTPTPRMAPNLHTYEMLGDTKGVLRAIYADLSPEQQRSWDRHGTQKKPLTFYRWTEQKGAPQISRTARAVSGTIAASGVMADSLGVKRSYVLIETKSGIKTEQLYFYSSPSLSTESLAPGMAVKLLQGEMSAVEKHQKRQKQTLSQGRGFLSKESIGGSFANEKPWSLYTYEMCGDKKGIMNTIYSGLTVEAKKQWDRYGTQKKPLSFYKDSQSISGKVLASGVILEPLGGRKSYVLIESSTGKLSYYSSASLDSETLIPDSYVKLSKGEALSQKESHAKGHDRGHHR